VSRRAANAAPGPGRRVAVSGAVPASWRSELPHRYLPRPRRCVRTPWTGAREPRSCHFGPTVPPVDSISIAAAAAAVVSAFFVWRQVRIMEGQTKQQREIAENAQQPYVWADVRVDQGFLLALVVGNEGPTIATNLQVTIEPPLPLVKNFELAAVQSQLRKGLASLGPGQSWTWQIGPAHELIGQDVAHVVTVTAQGPHGAVKTGPYVINMHNYNEAHVADPGSLKKLTAAVEQGFMKMPGHRDREPLHVRTTAVPQDPNED
jgi:hypothetical protein